MNTCVVGLGFGDEGKGKMVHILSSEHDYVIRYNGGANAGHTVCCKDCRGSDEVFKLHHIPSGAVASNKPILVLTHGMVIDPPALWEEICYLRKFDVDIMDRIFISDKAHCVMPWHLQSDAKKGGKIGTTRKGIGPCYAEKMNRWNAIRMGELFDKLSEERSNKFFTADGLLHGSGLWDRYYNAAQWLKLMVVDTGELLRKAVAENKNILFESANGIHLDIDFGTFPYCTSSAVGPAAIPQSCGLPNLHLDRIIGVTKAYTTRVGEGPMPSEINTTEAECDRDRYDPWYKSQDRAGNKFSWSCDCNWCMAHKIRERGNEYGTTTGRPRRIGWLDLDKLEEGVQYTGATEIALMHVDTLSEIGGSQIKVWSKSGVEKFSADRWIDTKDSRLDRFIEYIEKKINRPVSIVSLGPKDTETINRKETK